MGGHSQTQLQSQPQLSLTGRENSEAGTTLKWEAAFLLGLSCLVLSGAGLRLRGHFLGATELLSGRK
jgi:hypothetical protein